MLQPLDVPKWPMISASIIFCYKKPARTLLVHSLQIRVVCESNKKGTRWMPEVLVAGAGFEPTASGL